MLIARVRCGISCEGLGREIESILPYYMQRRLNARRIF